MYVLNCVCLHFTLLCMIEKHVTILVIFFLHSTVDSAGGCGKTMRCTVGIEISK